MEFGGLEKFTLIDYPGKIACIIFTIGCNFRCGFCHNPELVNCNVTERIKEKEILDFLESRKGLLEGVTITGGEPTMHGERLLNFIRKVKVMGFLVKLDSNGTNPDILQKAIDEKIIDYIAMDIKAPFAKYKEVTMRLDDLDSIKKSVKLIMESEIDYEFRTTVVKSQLSFEDFDVIGEEIRGAKNYYLQKFIPTKILDESFKNEHTYSDEEFKLLKEKMDGYVENCGIR